MPAAAALLEPWPAAAGVADGCLPRQQSRCWQKLAAVQQQLPGWQAAQLRGRQPPVALLLRAAGCIAAAALPCWGWRVPRPCRLASASQHRKVALLLTWRAAGEAGLLLLAAGQGRRAGAVAVAPQAAAHLLVAGWLLAPWEGESALAPSPAAEAAERAHQLAQQPVTWHIQCTALLQLAAEHVHLQEARLAHPPASPPACWPAAARAAAWPPAAAAWRLRPPPQRQAAAPPAWQRQAGAQGPPGQVREGLLGLLGLLALRVAQRLPPLQLVLLVVLLVLTRWLRLQVLLLLRRLHRCLHPGAPRVDI